MCICNRSIYHFLQQVHSLHRKRRSKVTSRLSQNTRLMKMARSVRSAEFFLILYRSCLKVSEESGFIFVLCSSMVRLSGRLKLRCGRPPKQLPGERCLHFSFHFSLLNIYCLRIFFGWVGGRGWSFNPTELEKIWQLGIWRPRSQCCHHYSEWWCLHDLHLQ